MQQTLNFVYTVMEIPPRCRKSRPVDKGGKTVIHVNELNAGQLPVAFVVHHYDEEKVIRFYDGRFFSIAKSHEKQRITIEQLKTRLECAARQHWGEQKIFDICNELQNVADRYVIVGDTVYEEIGEPRYCIYTFGLGNNHGGTCLSVDYHFNENIAAERYFPANAYDKAVATAYDIALLRGDTESLQRFRNREYIDVINDGYVRCDPSAHGSGNPLLKQIEQIFESTDDIDDTFDALAKILP